MKSKESLDILPGIKSRDKYNRDKMPKDTDIPKLPSNKSDKKYIDEAIKYVEKNFSKNYGNTDNFVYPIKRKIIHPFFYDARDLNDKFQIYSIFHIKTYL